MQDDMLFSLLLAHYNNSRYIDECINSVMAQTYNNWEIIVVNDGSTDDFENVISKYKNDSRIKVFSNEKNMGCSFTKRKCAELATGDIVAFLDPDDYIDPRALEIMVTAHANNPQCSLIHSTLYICDEEMNIVRKAEYPKSLPKNTPYLLVGDGSIHHFATFKRACYNRTQGLDPVRTKDKAIDQELYYLLEETGEVLFIDIPLYYYRIHGGSISNGKHEMAAKAHHYAIIEESCQRRIQKLKEEKTADSRYWIRKYTLRYHKVRILNGIQSKQWSTLLISSLIYPFVGGMNNILSFIGKLPKKGLLFTKRRFA